MAMGRPSKYNPKYHVPWAKSLAMEGKTDEEIADRLGIARSTLSKWKSENKEFAEALEIGKESADAEVELSMYKRAIGYRYKEKKVIVQMDKDGNQMPARIETVEKEIVPDVTAQIFWLKNRKPDKYRDKQDIAIEKDKDIKIIVAPASTMEKDEGNEDGE